VVDASVWVSRFLNTDAFHAASDAWLRHELGAGRTLAGPTLLLAEIAGVIRRETGDAGLAEQIATSVELHPQVRLFPLSPAMARRAVRLAAAHSLRGADAVYAAAAAGLRVPLVSWDGQHLRRAGAVEPGAVEPR
jgi:predicted nucleic acid-binding protein